MKKTWLISLIYSLVISVVSYEVPPRNAAYCAYLTKKIFCYGGSAFNEQYSNNMYYLDIHHQTTDSVSKMLNKWIEKPVNSQSEIATEYRYDSGFVALPNGVEMLFQGGTNDKNYSIADKTVTYNAETDTWNALPSYNDIRNGGYRQISAQSTVYISTMDSIGFYGGKEFRAKLGTGYITASGESLPNNLVYDYESSKIPGYQHNESYVGFYYLTLFNLKSHTWSVITAEPPKLNGLLYLVGFQTSSFHLRTGKIYYIGGLYKTTASDESLSVPFSFATTYDTVGGRWDNQSLTAAPNGRIPLARHLHSATMLSSNEDILIYGGTNLPEDMKPNGVMDYVYTLNLNTHTWVSHDITPSNNSPGPRYYHSAVLVDNSSVFILFGMNGGSATNNMLVLDVRDRFSIVFSETYPLSSETLSGGLSSGAIAGIAVGATVSVLIIAALAVFCIRKKKKPRFEEKTEEMLVDWDHIEGIFREVPSAANMNVRDSISPTTTIVSSPQVPFSITGHSANRASILPPLLVPDVCTAKPDAADKQLKLPKDT